MLSFAQKFNQITELEFSTKYAFLTNCWYTLETAHLELEWVAHFYQNMYFKAKTRLFNRKKRNYKATYLYTHRKRRLNHPSGYFADFDAAPVSSKKRSSFQPNKKIEMPHHSNLEGSLTVSFF